MHAGVVVAQDQDLLGKMAIPVNANMNPMIFLIRALIAKDRLSGLVQPQWK